MKYSDDPKQPIRMKKKYLIFLQGARRGNFCASAHLGEEDSSDEAFEKVDVFFNEL